MVHPRFDPHAGMEAYDMVTQPLADLAAHQPRDRGPERESIS
jgi:hypothetical protein